MNRLIDRKYAKRNTNMGAKPPRQALAKRSRTSTRRQHRARRMSILTRMVRDIMRDQGVAYLEARRRADEIMAKQQKDS